MININDTINSIIKTENSYTQYKDDPLLKSKLLFKKASLLVIFSLINIIVYTFCIIDHSIFSTEFKNTTIYFICDLVKWKIFFLYLISIFIYIPHILKFNDPNFDSEHTLFKKYYKKFENHKKKINKNVKFIKPKLSISVKFYNRTNIIFSKKIIYILFFLAQIIYISQLYNSNNEDVISGKLIVCVYSVATFISLYIASLKELIIIKYSIVSTEDECELVNKEVCYDKNGEEFYVDEDKNIISFNKDIGKYVKIKPHCPLSIHVNLLEIKKFFEDNIEVLVCKESSEFCFDIFCIISFLEKRMYISNAILEKVKLYAESAHLFPEFESIFSEISLTKTQETTKSQDEVIFLKNEIEKHKDNDQKCDYEKIFRKINIIKETIKK